MIEAKGSKSKIEIMIDEHKKDEQVLEENQEKQEINKSAESILETRQTERHFSSIGDQLFIETMEGILKQKSGSIVFAHNKKVMNEDTIILLRHILEHYTLLKPLSLQTSNVTDSKGKKIANIDLGMILPNA